MVMGHKVFDLGKQIYSTTEGVLVNSFFGDDVKPDFHLVQPGQGPGNHLQDLKKGLGH